MELCEGVSKSFVGGEDQHLKIMWKKGTTMESKAKLTMAVNVLPQWENAQDTSCTRRNFYIHMEKLFLDLNQDISNN